MDILSFLFPKRCVICKKIDSFLCANCFPKLSFDAKNICLSCQKVSISGLTHIGCRKKHAIDGYFSALSSSSVSKKLIYNFKNQPFLTGLKEVLGDLFYESLIQNEDFVKQILKGRWLIVSIPIPKSELRKRGYNPSEILAKELAKRIAIPFKNILTMKKKDGKELFQIAKELDFNNLGILLVQDVLKTSSGFLSATKVLKTFGVKKVIGAVLIKD
jgi:competence protein ComFC